MKNSTYESLVAKHGCKMVLLKEILPYIGLGTVKTAVELYHKGTLGFPIHKSRGDEGKWIVYLDQFADYQDELNREATEKFNYLHN